MPAGGNTKSSANGTASGTSGGGSGGGGGSAFPLTTPSKVRRNESNKPRVDFRAAYATQQQQHAAAAQLQRDQAAAAAAALAAAAAHSQYHQPHTLHPAFSQLQLTPNGTDASGFGGGSDVTALTPTASNVFFGFPPSPATAAAATPIPANALFEAAIQNGLSASLPLPSSGGAAIPSSTARRTHAALHAITAQHSVGGAAIAAAAANSVPPSLTSSTPNRRSGEQPVRAFNPHFPPAAATRATAVAAAAAAGVDPNDLNSIYTAINGVAPGAGAGRHAAPLSNPLPHAHTASAAVPIRPNNASSAASAAASSGGTGGWFAVPQPVPQQPGGGYRRPPRTVTSTPVLAAAAASTTVSSSAASSASSSLDRALEFGDADVDLTETTHPHPTTHHHTAPASAPQRKRPLASSAPSAHIPPFADLSAYDLNGGGGGGSGSNSGRHRSGDNPHKSMAAFMDSGFNPAASTGRATAAISAAAMMSSSASSSRSGAPPSPGTPHTPTAGGASGFRFDSNNVAGSGNSPADLPVLNSAAAAVETSASGLVMPDNSGFEELAYLPKKLKSRPSSGSETPDRPDRHPPPTPYRTPRRSPALMKQQVLYSSTKRRQQIEQREKLELALAPHSQSGGRTTAAAAAAATAAAATAAVTASGGHALIAAPLSNTSTNSGVGVVSAAALATFRAAAAAASAASASASAATANSLVSPSTATPASVFTPPDQVIATAPNSSSVSVAAAARAATATAAAGVFTPPSPNAAAVLFAVPTPVFSSTPYHAPQSSHLTPPATAGTTAGSTPVTPNSHHSSGAASPAGSAVSVATNMTAATGASYLVQSPPPTIAQHSIPPTPSSVGSATSFAHHVTPPVLSPVAPSQPSQQTTAAAASANLYGAGYPHGASPPETTPPITGAPLLNISAGRAPPPTPGPGSKPPTPRAIQPQHMFANMPATTTAAAAGATSSLMFDGVAPTPATAPVARNLLSELAETADVRKQLGWEDDLLPHAPSASSAGAGAGAGLQMSSLISGYPVSGGGGGGATASSIAELYSELDANGEYRPPPDEVKLSSQFDWIAVIGTGSFGEVWKVRDHHAPTVLPNERDGYPPDVLAAMAAAAASSATANGASPATAATTTAATSSAAAAAATAAPAATSGVSSPASPPALVLPAGAIHSSVGPITCSPNGGLILANGMVIPPSLLHEQYYAVKKSLRPFQSARERTLVVEEMDHVRRLGEHPNLIDVVQCWQEGGHFFIQTEWCSRGDLNVFLSRDERHGGGLPLTEALVWRLVFEISDGLAHVHKHGLIHMDIKPSNIYVDANATFKIGDFGTACTLKTDEHTAAAAAAATATAAPASGGGSRASSGGGGGGSGFGLGDEEGDSKYMAPEVFNRRPTTASDMFSFGITLYEIVSGNRLPANGVMYHALRSQKIPFDQLQIEITPELKELIIALMHPDPLQRPTAAQVLDHCRNRIARRTAAAAAGGDQSTSPGSSSASSPQPSGRIPSSPSNQQRLGRVMLHGARSRSPSPRVIMRPVRTTSTGAAAAATAVGASYRSRAPSSEEVDTHMYHTAASATAAAPASGSTAVSMHASNNSPPQSAPASRPPTDDQQQMITSPTPINLNSEFVQLQQQQQHHHQQQLQQQSYYQQQMQQHSNPFDHTAFSAAAAAAAAASAPESALSARSCPPPSPSPQKGRAKSFSVLTVNTNAAAAAVGTASGPGSASISRTGSPPAVSTSLSSSAVAAAAAVATATAAGPFGVSPRPALLQPNQVLNAYNQSLAANHMSPRLVGSSAGSSATAAGANRPVVSGATSISRRTSASASTSPQLGPTPALPIKSSQPFALSSASAVGTTPPLISPRSTLPLRLFDSSSYLGSSTGPNSPTAMEQQRRINFARSSTTTNASTSASAATANGVFSYTSAAIMSSTATALPVAATAAPPLHPVVHSATATGAGAGAAVATAAPPLSPQPHRRGKNLSADFAIAAAKSAASNGSNGAGAGVRR